MSSLRRYALVVGVWLLCVASAGSVLAHGNDRERASSLQDFDALADTGSSFVSAFTDDVFETMRRLAPQLTADVSSPQQLTSTAALLGFPTAVLLNRQGRAIAVAPEHGSVRGTDLVGRYRHLDSALAGNYAVSDVVPGAVEGSPVVGFAMPLYGARYGVLSVGMALNDGRLRAFLEHQLTAGHRAYVFDSTGTTVVLADNSPRGGTRLDLDVLSAVPPRGTEVVGGRLLAASSIVGTPWTYVLDAPAADVLDTVSSGNSSEWGLLVGLAALSLVGMIVATRALAGRAQVRREKAEADQRFRLTVQHAPVGMSMVDLGRRFVEPNTRMCRMLDYTDAELEAMTIDQVSHPDDIGLDTSMVDQLLSGDKDTYEMDQRFLRRDGSTLWGRLTVSVVRNEAGQARYFVSQIEDVTEMRAAQAELELRALYDPLTGLANRGLLVDRLTHALASAYGAGTVAVGFCDLDHFKQVNDTGGHHTGDAVLAAVAARLQSCVRSGDTVARIGGDEFVVLLTNVESVAVARQVMERARHAVEEPVVVDGAAYTVGLSTGLALAGSGDSAESLLRQADAALYVAKHSGRGRCEVHGATTGAPRPAPSEVRPTTSPAVLAPADVTR